MYANATLEVHNVADDKVVSSLPILVADDIVAAEGMPDAFHTTLPAYKTAATARANDANALLGKTKWIPLTDRNGNPPLADGGAPAVSASGYQVVLSANGKTLSLDVTSAANPQLGLHQDVSSALVAPRKPPKPQKGNAMCRFTPYVAEAAIGKQVAAVRIAQSVQGNVWGCFEPSRWHVYALGASGPTPAPSSAPSAASPK
jgi:hypothetical protein